MIVTHLDEKHLGLERLVMEIDTLTPGLSFCKKV